ncbi:MAG: hypothetical protein PWP23_2923 [Candidatus Sumerlaeota bacterium]|nr:hypothetical protein [Candidatus Sumerlaeota bacterium]
MRRFLKALGRGGAPAWPDHLTVRSGATAIPFDTSSAIAKSWFFPRYEKGTPHEEHILREIVEELGESDCFYDIGSNVGFFAHAVGCIAPKCRVHAFEMDPLLIAEIRRNVALNPENRCSIVQGAVWEDGGRLLSFDPVQPGNSSTNRVSTQARQAKLLCVSVRLDDYMDWSGEPPSVVKCDVEGAEVMVLRGAPGVLESVRLLMLELHPKAIASVGGSLSELCDILGNHRFSVEVITGHRNAAPSRSPVSLEEIAQMNANAMLVCRKVR